MLSYIIYIYIYIVCELYYYIYICLNHSWLIPVNPQDWLIGHVPTMIFLFAMYSCYIDIPEEGSIVSPGQVVVVRVLLALPGELLSALQLGPRHRGR